jgi:hypothetical protein
MKAKKMEPNNHEPIGFHGNSLDAEASVVV